jgi:hypothetical protein
VWFDKNVKFGVNPLIRSHWPARPSIVLHSSTRQICCQQTWHDLANSRTKSVLPGLTTVFQGISAV